MEGGKVFVWCFLKECEVFPELIEPLLVQWQVALVMAYWITLEDGQDAQAGVQELWVSIYTWRGIHRRDENVSRNSPTR